DIVQELGLFPKRRALPRLFGLFLMLLHRGAIALAIDLQIGVLSDLSGQIDWEAIGCMEQEDIGTPKSHIAAILGAGDHIIENLRALRDSAEETLLLHLDDLRGVVGPLAYLGIDVAHHGRNGLNEPEHEG